MVAPNGLGAVRCMQMALAGVRTPVDYLNTHGTATPLGDLIELQAVREVFGAAVPPLSSTKSLSGHSLGAASVHEAIYSPLMLRDGFIAGSANIDSLDPQAAAFPIVRASRPAALNTVMSNSFWLRRHQRYAGIHACLSGRFLPQLTSIKAPAPALAEAAGRSPTPQKDSSHMTTTATPALAEQAQRALAAHDRNAEVTLAADGGFVVRTELTEAEVRRLLQAAALPVAARTVPARSDCCGGCGGA